MKNPEPERKAPGRLSDKFRAMTFSKSASSNISSAFRCRVHRPSHHYVPFTVRSPHGDTRRFSTDGLIFGRAVRATDPFSKAAAGKIKAQTARFGNAVL